jgi:surfactin synthase thioesterase subunit
MSQWFVRQSNSKHRLRLFCFSYAGGNATIYHPWQQAFHPEIEICAVQLPGRGRRLMQPPYTEFTRLVEDLAQVIVQLNGQLNGQLSGQANEPERPAVLPFAFFGHSLGALLGFEIARYFRHHHLPMPLHLFTSGCNAPQQRNPPKGMHLMSDSELIESLRRYNGTPNEILANRELMALVLPTIRADFRMVEEYVYQPAAPLSIPITVLAGRKDEYGSPAQAQAWQHQTQAPCELHWFEGDHFFIHPENAAVRSLLERKLQKSLEK